MWIMKKYICIITACTLLNVSSDFSLSAMAYNNIENKTEEKTALRLAAENKNLKFYVDDSSGEIALKDKNGNIWYSSPQNAEDDPIAAPSVISDLQSPLSITYCEPKKRVEASLYSKSSSSVKVKNIDNGVEITYKFKKAGITIPLRLTLFDDYLEAEVDTSNIKESREDKKLTGISIMSSFGAADSDDNGYFIIPDGCGAIINFNNGKVNSKSYARMVYGQDITMSPLTMPDNTSQVYLPMYGIVKGSSGLMTVCTNGDSNAMLTASVSGLSKSSYNLCSFEFILRSSDNYYISNDTSSVLTVFESGDIKTDKISLRYYPVEDSDKSGIDYVDIAKSYRDYLINDMNVKRTADSSPELYIDLYGGTEKKHSFLGIPVTVKKSLTTSSQAAGIMRTLKNLGVSNMTVCYNKWTDSGIKNRIDVSAEASNTIENEEFYELLNHADENNATIYPGVQNVSFTSGGGYSVHGDAAVRISGEYARLYDYDIVSGRAYKDKNVKFLLSPNEYPKMFSKLAENFKNKGIENICLSELANSLCGDYDKSGISRDKTQQILLDGFKTLDNSLSSILADNANAYAFPYIDKISNVPLCSGGYDIFDEDIPFYQIVLHGFKSYSTEPINGSADDRKLMLNAIASGSNPHYDMIGESAGAIKDTELDGLYYAYYDNWTEQAAKDFLFAKEILLGVQDKAITGYRKSGNKTYTEYEDGTLIIVDFEKESVSVNENEYYLSDYTVNGA